MPLFLVLFSLFLDHFFVVVFGSFLCFFACSLCLSVGLILCFAKYGNVSFLCFFSHFLCLLSFLRFLISMFLCLFPFLSVCRIICFAKKKSLSFVSSLIFFAFYFFVSLFLCLFPFLSVCLTLCFASQESPSGSRVSEDGRASLLPSFLPRRRRRRRRWA